jgi:proteasome lid subunit RPN8/RPN11
MAAVTLLRLSKEIAERIRKHGVETYPHECCGALLGRDSNAASQGEQTPPRDVLDLFPLVNRRDDSPRNRFSVTSEDVLAAEKAGRLLGIDVVGWYHSHPDHPAEPSQYDRDHAWPWYSYIIVSVANGQPQRMTSWRLNDDRAGFTSEDLEIGQRASV